MMMPYVPRGGNLASSHGRHGSDYSGQSPARGGHYYVLRVMYCVLVTTETHRRSKAGGARKHGPEERRAWTRGNESLRPHICRMKFWVLNDTVLLRVTSGQDTRTCCEAMREREQARARAGASESVRCLSARGAWVRYVSSGLVGCSFAS